jgi:hypothetical protein
MDTQKLASAQREGKGVVQCLDGLYEAEMADSSAQRAEAQDRRRPNDRRTQTRAETGGALCQVAGDPGCADRETRSGEGGCAPAPTGAAQCGWLGPGFEGLAERSCVYLLVGGGGLTLEEAKGIHACDKTLFDQDEFVTLE